MDMWKDALLLTLSCTLFVQMGLSSAIQKKLHFTSELISCPKCLTFWANLAYLTFFGHGTVVEIVGASFLCSYAALWVAVLYDALALLYNRFYEYITEADGASEDAPADSGENTETGDSDEVPTV